MPAPAPPATSSLDPDGTAKAQRLIDGLSAGGNVAMPLQPPSGPAVPHQHRPLRRAVDNRLRGRDETPSLAGARGVACACAAGPVKSGGSCVPVHPCILARPSHVRATPPHPRTHATHAKTRL